MRHPHLLPLSIALIGLGFVVGLLLGTPTGTSWSQEATPVPPPTLAPPPAEALILLDAEEAVVAYIYESAGPSVVHITSRTEVWDFWRGVVPQEGTGSGFVYDTQGHIVTNNHVVEDAQEIEVVLADGTVLLADVVGTDAYYDLAVLHVDPAQLPVPPLPLGSAETLRVGQRVLAIGNPFGLDRTLTTGVISALDRTIEGPDNRTITGIIQTDAAINKGNSGGPLLDSSGRVIGITSAIFSPTGTSAGVGFAVPVDTLKRLLPDLLTLGRYRHPWLGIRYAYNVTPGLAEVLKLPVQEGLLLVQLYDGSPLLEAGVRGAQRQEIIGAQRVYTGGDLLTAVNGQKVSSIAELETLLESNHRVGDVVTISIIRDGRTLELEATLAEEPH